MTPTPLKIHSLQDGYCEINLRTPTLPIKRYTKKIEYFMDIGPGQTVLDFGCGDGAVTAMLADCYPSSRFIGVDYSAELIAYAARENARSNVTYLTADLERQKLPFEDASVDKIFSWGVMQYISPNELYEKYQAEFIRVLKTPGRLCHFQIPLRFVGVGSEVSLGNFSIAGFFKKVKGNFSDLVSGKHGEHAYKYSKRDFMKSIKGFSSAMLIADDFFIGRASVVYDK